MSSSASCNVVYSTKLSIGKINATRSAIRVQRERGHVTGSFGHGARQKHSDAFSGIAARHEGPERMDSFLGYAGIFFRPTSFNFSAGINHDLTQTNTNTGRELSDEFVSIRG